MPHEISSSSSIGERKVGPNSEMEEEKTIGKGKGKAKMAIEVKSESLSDDDEQVGRKYQRNPSEIASISKRYLNSLFILR